MISVLGVQARSFGIEGKDSVLIYLDSFYEIVPTDLIERKQRKKSKKFVRLFFNLRAFPFYFRSIWTRRNEKKESLWLQKSAGTSSISNISLGLSLGRF